MINQRSLAQRGGGADSLFASRLVLPLMFFFEQYYKVLNSKEK
jgi:hypothetical protein